MEFPLENTNPESDQSNKSENFTSIFQQVFSNTSNMVLKKTSKKKIKIVFFIMDSRKQKKVQQPLL